MYESIGSEIELMSEKTLREEQENLLRILRDGEATIRTANKLAEIRAALKRIDDVRSGV